MNKDTIYSLLRSNKIPPEVIRNILSMPEIETSSEADILKEAKRQKRNYSRRIKNQIMRDLGLTRVKGSLGGVYWE